MGQSLSNCMYAFTILGSICFILSVYLFFRYDIKTIFSELIMHKNNKRIKEMYQETKVQNKQIKSSFHQLHTDLETTFVDLPSTETTLQEETIDETTHIDNDTTLIDNINPSFKIHSIEILQDNFKRKD